MHSRVRAFVRARVDKTFAGRPLAFFSSSRDTIGPPFERGRSGYSARRDLPQNRPLGLSATRQARNFAHGRNFLRAYIRPEPSSRGTELRPRCIIIVRRVIQYSPRQAIRAIGENRLSRKREISGDLNLNVCIEPALS